MSNSGLDQVRYFACNPVSLGHNATRRISFTGSRDGMTEQQKQTLIQVLQEYQADGADFALLPR